MYNTESLTRGLIEVSLDTVVTIGIDGTITDANEAAVRVTGRSRDELIGTDFCRYFTAPDEARQEYQRVLDDGGVRGCQLAIRHTDGHATDVLYSASLYRDEQGLVQGVIATARDITEGQRATVLANRLSAIVEGSDDAIIGMDLNGIVTSWNRGAEKLFGYAAGEMTGTPIQRLIPLVRYPEEHDILERIRHGEPVKHFDTERLTKDGRRIDVSVTASPIRDDKGRIIGVSKVARDITDSKRQQAEIRTLYADTEVRVRARTFDLAESDERLRMATEAAAIGIWDWDLVSNTIRWDPLMFRIYGMRPRSDGHVRYDDWKYRVHPDDLANQEALLRLTVEQVGRRTTREFRIIRESDQVIRTIRASDAAIAGEDGRTRRVVGINLDVTDNIERLEEIRTLNARLRSRAAELEASVKELDAFSYSVSHDLRAPLRAIDGFSRILVEDYAPKLDDEGKRVIGVIRGEAQRMGRLIDDLLSFSRLGRQRAEPVKIDMESTARQIFDELMAQEPDRRVRLDLHPLPPAFGTEAMIRQLWTNLIGNAIKFTGKREFGEVEIGATLGEAGEQVYFVRDNGAGFDMRYADKLFGVFSRLHGSEEFPGTGVGLALVKRIVDRHGGRVWGEAEVGKGATFFFTIPNPGSETGDKPPSSTTLPP